MNMLGTLPPLQIPRSTRGGGSLRGGGDAGSVAMASEVATPPPLDDATAAPIIVPLADPQLILTLERATPVPAAWLTEAAALDAQRAAQATAPGSGPDTFANGGIKGPLQPEDGDSDSEAGDDTPRTDRRLHRGPKHRDAKVSAPAPPPRWWTTGGLVLGVLVVVGATYLNIRPGDLTGLAAAASASVSVTPYNGGASDSRGGGPTLSILHLGAGVAGAVVWMVLWNEVLAAWLWQKVSSSLL